MASNRKNFFSLGLIPNTSTTANAYPGDIEYLSSDGKLHVRGASANDAIVTEVLVSTLTNKTISGSTNTLLNISNGSLTNSSLTVNGNAVSLGGSTTITAVNPNALTIGAGLSGTSYTGSSSVTVAIDSTVVTLTGTQTLTNKTLTSPIINNPTSDIITAIGTTLTLNGTILKLNGLSVVSSLLSDFGGATGVTISSSNVANGITLTASAGTIKLNSNGNNVARVDANSFTALKPVQHVDNGGINYVAITAPSSVSSSYTITLPGSAPITNSQLSYDGTNYLWSSVSNASVAFSAINTSSQSISQGILTTLTGWTTENDTGFFVASTGIATITTAGRYSIAAAAYLNSGAGGTLFIYKNGSSIRQIGFGSNSQGANISAHSLVFAVNDSVVIKINVLGSGTVTLASGAFFSMVRTGT
jgi:hypothetical protein